MAETCKIGEHEYFAVLTMQHSLAMKYINIKRTLAKQLHGGDALCHFSFWYCTVGPTLPLEP